MTMNLAYVANPPTQYQPGKWLPDGSITLGYLDPEGKRTFAWGYEVTVRFRFRQEHDPGTDEWGTPYVMESRVSWASGAQEPGEDLDAWVDLLHAAQAVAWAVSLKLETMGYAPPDAMHKASQGVGAVAHPMYYSEEEVSA